MVFGRAGRSCLLLALIVQLPPPAASIIAPNTSLATGEH
jgi:hypothetical protein